jgi:hypothetical protein
LVGLNTEPDFRVAYTDADTIKAVAEESSKGVVGIKNKNGSGYDAE